MRVSVPIPTQSLGLENDPRKVPPETIKDIVLEATYLGGEKVYTAAAKAVVIVPLPLLNYGDGNYGDGDESATDPVPGRSTR
jgi:hypothetical protein